MMRWPGSNDYTVAIQNPGICFRNPDLKNATVEKHPLTRMPKVWTGNFAQVYELRSGQKRWAVKCFTRSAQDLRVRYAEISTALESARLPYFVEFKFLADEMLVGGNRFPVVKMQWIEGKSLDKYVEANLFNPGVLHDLIAELIRMVRQLKEKGFAHGDLQHGNIFLHGRDVKLVDYDGMFIPSFRGKLAPEFGLPSYQHPRRDASVYDASLDHFPLLVICAALSALARDPSLWYEFNTGENILFTRQDFESPVSSQLFKRVRALGDSSVDYFLKLLTESCSRGPTEVPIPDQVPSGFSGIGQRWWVTSGSVAPPKTASKPVGGIPPTILSLSRLHARFVVLAAALVFLGWLRSISFLGTGVVGCLSLLAFMAYFFERWVAFGALPIFTRRKALIQDLRTAKMQVDAQVLEQSKLKNAYSRLSQLETQERTGALKRLQEEHITRFLERIDITRLTEIRGIGDFIITNLRSVGIRTAKDLNSGMLFGVTGIGQRRRAVIESKLADWKAQASRDLPATLPAHLDSQITGKYAQQKRTAQDQLASTSRNIANTQTRIAKVESNLLQLYVPSFAQFLKHHF